jgi:hypothetical protein
MKITLAKLISFKSNNSKGRLPILNYTQSDLLCFF